jgi:hypothetical protein
MSIAPSKKDFDEGKNVSHLRLFEQAHREDLAAIVDALASMTRRTPSEVKPHFDKMLKCLVQQSDRPFDDPATPPYRAQAFREWVESHREMNLPSLSDRAISRESIYGERD